MATRFREATPLPRQMRKLREAEAEADDNVAHTEDFVNNMRHLRIAA